MSARTHSTFAAFIGPGLTLLTAASAYVNGVMSAVTTTLFALTVLWSLVETALQTYTPVSLIELDGPAPLDSRANDTDASAPDTPAGTIVPFSDPNPRHAERAA